MPEIEETILKQLAEIRARLGRVEKMEFGTSASLLSTGFIKEAFPVGAIFIAVVSTNPATLLGYGTWSAFGAGKVLVGIDAGQAEFDTVEETGGAKTHTLITNEIPVHYHPYGAYNYGVSVQAGSNYSGYTQVRNTGNAGGGAAHNNLQPYIVVYMWKRTA